MLAASLCAVHQHYCSSSQRSETLSRDVTGSARAAAEPILNSSWHSSLAGPPLPKMYECGPNAGRPGDVSGGIIQYNNVERVVSRWRSVPAQRWFAKGLQLTLKTKGGDAAALRSIFPRLSGSATANEKHAAFPAVAAERLTATTSCWAMHPPQVHLDLQPRPSFLPLARAHP